MKNCEFCDSRIEKKQNESKKYFASKRFCSNSCRMASRTGEQHSKWKGDDAGYLAFHAWVARNFGTPNYCEACETTEERVYHWAMVDKNNLTRDRDGWMRLCVPCHKQYDLASNEERNQFTNQITLDSNKLEKLFMV